MSQPTTTQASTQFRGLLRSLVVDPMLLFAQVFASKTVAQVVEEEVGETDDRIYTPLVTLALFLYQILSNDHSCRNAVARLRSWRVAHGLKPCSLATGGYCTARQRLPETLLPRLVRDTGTGLHEQAPSSWLFRDRPVVIADGTTVSMPDTPRNQKAYPQHPNQKRGRGFPIARIVVLLSLATGAALDLAIGPWSGKLTGESTLLRGLRNCLKRGTILLADRYYSSYPEIAALLSMGVDVMMRQHAGRLTDFRQGQKLGREDHLAVWHKSRQRRSWMSMLLFRRIPRTIVMRELRVRVNRRGFRTKQFVVVTSLLDPIKYPAKELAGLYRARWHAELDIRSIKTLMQMDVLRCKSPEMVRKEIWAHMLMYNLVRAVMAEAAHRSGLQPRVLSFQGTRQVIKSYRADLARATPAGAEVLRADALLAVAGERVGDRPDRYEPRARKRREKMYPRLQEPRSVARKRLARAG
jgi:Transposase DDE domain